MTIITLAPAGYSFDAFARGGGGSWERGTGEVVFFLIWLLACAWFGLLFGHAKDVRARCGLSFVILIMVAIAAIFAGPRILLMFATAAALAALLGAISNR